MIFFAHSLKASVRMQTANPTMLEFDRMVSADEFAAAMSQKRFDELGCVLVYQFRNS